MATTMMHATTSRRRAFPTEFQSQLDLITTHLAHYDADPVGNRPSVEATIYRLLHQETVLPGVRARGQLGLCEMWSADPDAAFDIYLHASQALRTARRIEDKTLAEQAEGYLRLVRRAPAVRRYLDRLASTLAI